MHTRYLLSVTTFFAPIWAQTNVLTYHNDLARTGQNLGEKILTTGNVNSTAFGKLFQATLDGSVDAQPLYIADVPIPHQGTHNLLIVATEHDSIYALDADTGQQIWKTSVLPKDETPSDDQSCSQVSPQIGITSTPAVDISQGVANGFILAVGMTKTSSNYYQRLNKVSLTTGTPMLPAVTISAKYPGTGEDSTGGYAAFDPMKYKERAALLLLDGVVYMTWASNCDHQPYTGWIMGYDVSTLKQVSVLDVTPNGRQGAIWGGGAGPAADSDNYIYLMDANGTFDTDLTPQGFPKNGNYGNAFIKLSAANNHLSVADYFTMYNTVDESDNDRDLGSGGAVVLPDMQDANGVTRRLAIGAGKESNIYLVNRDNMGKFNSHNDSAIYQELDGAIPGGQRGSPAYFEGQVYFAADGGPIRAFQFHNAKLSSQPSSATAVEFPYPGATPSISANGSNNGILWAVENSARAVLHAYKANNLAEELYNTGQAPNGRDNFGAGNKFMVPTIANGKVYVGTPDGVAAFGLLRP